MLKPPSGPRSLQALIKRRKQNRKKGNQPGTSSKQTGDHSNDGSDVEDYSDSEDEGSEGYKKGGYHPVYIGEKYKDGRYVVLKKLGWGHFSTVWLVLDRETNQYGALKVQKSAQHYTEAARDEITLLSQIRDGDPKDERHCVRLLDSFDHQGPHGKHVCMVFEVLGENLLALIKHYDYRGIPVPVVRNLARQMLIGLDYLHREREIIHTDFKPENVMLCDPLYERVWALPSAGQLAAAGRNQRLPASAAAARAGCKVPTPSNSSGGGAAPAAAESSDTSGLTKNQKKKLKKKKKKQAKAAAGADGGDDGAGGSDDEASGDEADSGPASQGAALPASAADSSTAAGPAGTEAAADAAGSKGQAAEGTGGEQPGPSNGASEGGDANVIRQPGLTEEGLLSARCKLVDFGNACWTYKQFTTDIQTRQYRAPEVILGAKYSWPCDMWSLACMIFELVTGDLLFDPRAGDNYDRDEDHLALFIELLGRMPRKVYEKGKYASNYFNRSGELRHIKRLKYWPLDRVLVEKYKMEEQEALSLSGFLLPMLEYIPEKRATAASMLSHPWLTGQLPPPPPVPSSGAAAAGSREQGGADSAQRDTGHAHTKSSRSPSPSPAGHGKQGGGQKDGKAQQAPDQQQQQQQQQEALTSTPAAAAKVHG
eukprot:CAMPEP_0202894760 /NCGR_PEP_ID=MMETSP1392-20130828/4082_1 /ASSEMBLY_ACC=CAM_ASM_000868 /TAXON_ID=225041 /ORGANISM="Chlamydomonas chlamydogama, Strain SAG 11-48b" /LENGTH=652 /DNA_ID=CAMNT_0049579543 /DNA_START=42 /DNA_END=2000 /DNA_ORIENTATION=+